MPTILTGSAHISVPAERTSRDAVWLTSQEAETSTGWTLQPKGFCKGDVCVPVPPGRANEFASEGKVNVAALWRHMGWPVVHDAGNEVWVLGTSAAENASRLQSLEAPDFSLPDLQGRMHALRDYRGQKVLVVSWASW